MKFKLESTDVIPIDILTIELKKEKKTKTLIFRDFYEDLCKEKEKIDTLESGNEWDRIKKIGNPYELIYTSNNNKRKKKDSISQYQPISRSYFKMWEIFFNFSEEIFGNGKINFNENLVYGNLAEGPGGFMEAIYNYRRYCMPKYVSKNREPADVYYGITLRPNNEYVPDWNKMRKIFGSKQNVHIDYGNLYNFGEVKSYVRNFARNKAFIVTADGGFDYSADFNGQEISSCQIIYSECVVAMCILRERGTFVCKVFDLFTSTMVRILYLLHSNFDEVYFYKPDTSRPANSEKYLVCVGYKNLLTEDEKAYLLHLIQEYQMGVTNNLESDETFDLKGIRVPGTFFASVRQYNELYIRQQKFYLENTIRLAFTKIPKEEYDGLINKQIKNAVDWCRKYHIPINTQSCYLANVYVR